MTFNLIDEPWIPVLKLDGTAAQLSLVECFAQADQIRRISAELPTQSFALLRVMLAICHDAIGFHTDNEIEDLLEEGVDFSRIRTYLTDLRDRFDLFHAERPFMQVAGLRTAKDEASGLEKLISDVPNGTPFLTTRTGAAVDRISAAEAAVWLIHCQAFDPSGIRSGALGDDLTKGGKGYPVGPGWCGQIGGLLLHGRSLAQTLAYNLVPTPKNPLDRPVWAHTEPHSAVRQVEPHPRGPVELLVWQSRRVRLVGDHTGVTGVVLSQGDKMTPQNRQDLEAMTAWRFSKPQTKKFGIPVYMPLKHDPERAAWRGAPGLLAPANELVEGKEATLPPETVRSLQSHSSVKAHDLSVTIELVGMDYGPQEATVAELVSDSLDFRMSLLADDAAHVVTMAHDAIKVTDRVVWALGRMAGNVAAASGDFDGVDGAADRAKLTAWAALDSPARAWLADLHADTDTVESHREWQRTVRDVLLEQASQVTRRCSPAAVAGRKTKFGFMNAALAEVFFRKALREELSLAYQQPPSKESNE